MATGAESADNGRFETLMGRVLKYLGYGFGVYRVRLLDGGVSVVVTLRGGVWSVGISPSGDMDEAYRDLVDKFLARGGNGGRKLLGRDMATMGHSELDATLTLGGY